MHCLGSDIIISMLGDAKGNAPGGFLHLNEDFDIVGRWENDLGGMKFNYDFWYQPRHNVMVSIRMGGAEHLHAGLRSRGGRPPQIRPRDPLLGLSKKKRVEKTVYLGEDGLVPLEVRFHHNPDSAATASSAPRSPRTSSTGTRRTASGSVEKIIDVENRRHPEWPIPGARA